MCRVPKGTPIMICHFYQPMNWLATLLWYLRHHSIGCPHSRTCGTIPLVALTCVPTARFEPSAMSLPKKTYFWVKIFGNF